MQTSIQTLPTSTRSSRITTFIPLCIGILSVAFGAILIKFSEQEISAYATAFNRFWLTAATLGLWNGTGKIWQQWFGSEEDFIATEASLDVLPDAGILGHLFLLGVFLAVDLMLWAWALTQTSVANATLLSNLTPVFSCLGAWLILGKRFDRRFVLGMAIAIAAVCLIGVDDFQIDFSKLIGDAGALLGAALYGVYLAMLEQLQTRCKNSQLSTSTVLFWSSVSATVVILPIALLAGGNLFPVSIQGWLSVLGLAVVCQILGQGMLVHSLNQFSAEVVSLFLLLDPILAGIAAWLILSEQLSILNLLAFGIALLGIYLSVSSPSAAQQVSESVHLDELGVELVSTPSNDQTCSSTPLVSQS